MMKEYAHYKNYPASKWRWPNFKPIELRSKSDNKLAVNEDAMDKLQALRTLIDRPMKITSAYRSPAHNKKVGGARASKHLRAEAFDIQMEGHDPAQFEAAAREVGFLGFGFYEKHNFIHIDIGPKREWYGKGETSRWFTKASFYQRGPIPDMAQMDEPDVKPKVNPVPVVAVGGIAAAVAIFWDKVQAFIGGMF